MRRRIGLVMCVVMLATVVGLRLSGTTKADTPVELSTKLANILKNGQIDCDNDGTKDLWKDTWTGGGGSWDDYTMVLWGTASPALTEHGDTTEADNALTYVFTTNLNWAMKATEEPIVGTGGSAWYGDGSANDPGKTGGKMDSAWFYTTTDWGGSGRRSSAENMENLVIACRLLAEVGKYDEAATIADAIIGQTSTNKPWSNNRQYWDTDHLEFEDWGQDDSLLETVGFRNALEIITNNSAHDYSTEITAINNWKGGNKLAGDGGEAFSTWNEAIDYWFGDESGAGAAGEDWSGYFRYVWFTKLSANDDAINAQAVADNVQYSTMSYRAANLWAIIMMDANGQSTEASKMTASLFNKYWDYDNDVIINASQEDWAAATLLMANEVAAVSEPDEVWVDDDYCDGCDNDGHQWAYDAFATIQDGIDAVAGSTVNVAAGTYNENIAVDKKVSIIGAGSGDDPSTNTILRKAANAPVVTLTGSGISAIDPILFKDLRLEPVNALGFDVPGGTVSFIELDNVKVIGTNETNDTENERGLNVAPTASLTDLVIRDSSFDHLTYGWYFFKEVSVDTSTVERVTVSSTSFSNNDAKGIYVEKLSDATFTDVTVNDNGVHTGFWNATWNAGFDINLKAGTYQNLAFVNCAFTDNALGGAKEGVGLTVKGRGTGNNPSSSYAAYPAHVDNVTISGGTFSGNERGMRFGEPGKENAGPTNVVVQYATIAGNVQTYTGSDGSAYGGLVNQMKSDVQVVAEKNWWGSATGPCRELPNGKTVGKGDRVSGNVDYVPWLPRPIEFWHHLPRGR